MMFTNSLNWIVVVGACVACSCAAGPGRSVSMPPGAGVHIAVPARDASGTSVEWYGKEVAVELLPGPVRVNAEAHRILVPAVWGVAWQIGDEDLARIRAAILTHGEACLVFEGRPFAWDWDDRTVSPRGTFVNWPGLSEQDAVDLAARVSASGR